MPNEMSKKATQAVEKATGKLFCTNCNEMRLKQGGVWKIMQNGTRRRFKCAQCVENQKNRTAAAASTATIS
jgi:molybdenum cofactor biosynthesis enzyme MoaA